MVLTVAWRLAIVTPIDWESK